MLYGIADGNTVQFGVNASGNWRPMFRGTAAFKTHLAPEVRARLVQAYVSASQPERVPRQMTGVPAINYVGDADLCSRALARIAQLVDMLGSPCFNHPEAVARTTRDALPRALRDVPGLLLPRVERIHAGSARDLAQRIEALGLRYPLLLRVPGTQTGQTVHKVDAPEALDAATYSMPIGKQGVYATEFIDFRDDDGLYRKMRLVVVGGEVFIRHWIVAPGWSIHSADRSGTESAEERRVLDGFPASLPVDLRHAALAIADALGLDYFGIDCSLRADGRLLIFEANPAMNILDPHWKGPNGHWEKRLADMRAALSRLLLDPARWRRSIAARPA
ncbi:MAG TPA: hypothetical protein VH835_06545 [Dongiaceae bacterium]